MSNEILRKMLEIAKLDAAGLEPYFNFCQSNDIDIYLDEEHYSMLPERENARCNVFYYVLMSRIAQSIAEEAEELTGDEKIKERLQELADCVSVNAIDSCFDSEIDEVFDSDLTIKAVAQKLVELLEKNKP